MHDRIYISSFVSIHLFIRSFRFILIANNDNHHRHHHRHRIFGTNIGTNVFRKDFKINRSVQAMPLLQHTGYGN